MSRSFPYSGANNTKYSNHIDSELTRPVFLLEADFDGTTERLCTAEFNIDVDGTIFYGAGDFLSISEIDEASELRNAGINITLSGLDSSIINHALTTDYQDRTLTIYMGMFDTTSGNTESPILIAATDLPPIIFVGRMDTMTITEDGSSSIISLTVENRLADFERTAESRYTYEEQISRHSGDYSLEHVVTIQKRVLPWGQ